MLADLHTHTTASDGTLSPEQLIARAKTAGVTLLSITDHDTIAAYSSLPRHVDNTIQLVPGIEFSSRWRKYGGEPRAAERSAYTERAIFGQMTTGSYSNADLVANYEGHRFYRSLFEDGIVPGKKSILTWNGERWEVQRPFDWADHVNAYWDEGLNFNHYGHSLYKRMVVRLRQFCGDYHAAPALYYIENEKPLQEKYNFLQLRETSELRLPNLCESNPGDLHIRTVR